LPIIGIKIKEKIMEDNIQNEINRNAQENQYGVSAVPFHIHNGSDSSQLSPEIALSGFPVIKVTSASTSPSDKPQNGTFRFLVDSTPNYYLWSYLLNPLTNKTGWVGTKLGASVTQNQYTGSISHDNVTGSDATYTDTITCNFAATSAIFFFKHQYNYNTLYIRGNGWQGKTAGHASTWNCSGNASSGDINTSYPVSSYYPTTYASITTWGTTSVTVTSSITTGFGSTSQLDITVILLS
jgi:hypothetical protein